MASMIQTHPDTLTNDIAALNVDDTNQIEPLDNLPEAEKIESHLDSDVSFGDNKLGMGVFYDALPVQVKNNLENARQAAITILKYDKMFPIQKESIQYIAKGDNLIAQAPGGAGKTIAFCFGLLAHIDTRQPYTQGAIIGMTRELARQIYEDALIPLATNMQGLKNELFLKGFTPDRVDRCNAHIVVGTYGKLDDLLKKRFIDFSRLRVLVLDEADELLMKVEDGGDGSKQVIRIRYMTPPDCQVLLFSATFPPEVDKYAKEFIGKGKRSLVNLKLPSEASLMIPERKQFFMRSHTRNNGKIEILREIYEYIQSNQSIVFCNTIKAVEETQRLMTELNCPCSILHSKLPTEADRDKAIDEFRGKNLPEGVRPSKVLICTDVIARGVDIPNVNLVVNYELPFKSDRRGNKSVDYETYAHRIARCARAGRHGTVINFVHDAKDSESVKSIINHFSDGDPDPSLIKEWGADPEGPDGGVEGLYRDEIEEAEARVNSIAEAKKLTT